MTVYISVRLDAPASVVWQTTKKTATLIFVTRGLLGFSTGEFPVQWQAGETTKTRLWFFNFIPAWSHILRVVAVDDAQQTILTNESGGVVKIWNHRISVQPQSEKSCLYSDEIAIEAGLFTPLVWLFAQFFYRYRQSRWRRLVSGLGATN